LERGLSLRGMARGLGFTSHSPEPYQLVAYESGRLGAHHRTRLVIAAALRVPVSELVAVSTSR
jgi:hypothetical protein